MSTLYILRNAIILGIIGCTLGFAGTAYAKSSTCSASWYGPGLQGNRMANGQIFDMNDPTVVAHKSLPFGTKLRLTNLKNDRFITAIVQDRGPFIPGRCLDLSKAAASRLGFIGAGTTTIAFEVVR